MASVALYEIRLKENGALLMVCDRSFMAEALHLSKDSVNHALMDSSVLDCRQLFRKRVYRATKGNAEIVGDVDTIASRIFASPSTVYRCAVESRVSSEGWKIERMENPNKSIPNVFEVYEEAKRRAACGRKGRAGTAQGA